MIEDIIEKFKKGIETKYINDLKVMKDFNEAQNSIEQDKILELFFDEFLRMFLEFKMVFLTHTDYIVASNRLNYYLKKTVESLQFDYDCMLKLRKKIL